MVESVPTVLYLASLGISAVATFGSSVTDQQIRYLRRFQDGVVIAPDNDDAGIKFAGLLADGLDRYVPIRMALPPETETGDLGDYEPDELKAVLSAAEAL